VLSEKQVHFYDGCIVVEVRDFRSPTVSRGTDEVQPRVHRVLLEPGYDTVVRDAAKLAAANSIQTDWELLEIERRLLLAVSRPLCLVPDPNVFLIGAATNFKERKFEIEPEVLSGLRAQVGLVATATAGAAQHKSELYRFLLQRYGERKPRRASGGGGGGQALPVYGLPPQTSGSFQPIITPNMNESISGRLASANDFCVGREIKWDRAAGRRIFHVLRIMQVSGRPGIYSAIQRIGASPDNDQNGVRAQVVLGYKENAVTFLEQMASLLQREGYIKSYTALPPSIRTSSGALGSSAVGASDPVVAVKQEPTTAGQGSPSDASQGVPSLSEGAKAPVTPGLAPVATVEAAAAAAPVAAPQPSAGKGDRPVRIGRPRKKE
jgi:hypothetical protein